MHSCLAGIGQRGESTPAILGTGLAAHEAGFGKAVDGSGEAARRERRLGGEVAHPQPAARCPGQPEQDLEVLAGEFALALQWRADGSTQP